MRARAARAVSRRHRTTTGVALAVAGATATLAYARVARPRMHRWGATDEEVACPLAGDALVERPSYVTTLAVSVRAQPRDIWPWLVQMGYRRGGLYSYDWLDRLFGYLDRRSATEILREFQHLAPGDTIPIGRGPSWPVAIVEPERALVLEPVAHAISWAFVLVPVDANTTRLITRVRCRVDSLASRTFIAVLIDPAAFIMTRRMLVNLRRRSERLAQRRQPD